MKTVKRFLQLTGLVVGLLRSAEAQEGERLYPFVELTDADLAQIDVTDGSIDEWVDLLGEPTLTPLDFQTRPEPGFMIRRIWITASGWPGTGPPTASMWRSSARVIYISISLNTVEGSPHVF